MNYTYEHLEEQEEAHLSWIVNRQKWWRKIRRISEIGQAITNWIFSALALWILFFVVYPANIFGAFICVFAGAALHCMWGTVIASSQEGLYYMIELQGRSEQSLEDIRRLKREWRGY